MQWYYSNNTTQLGPVSDAELRTKLVSGEVSASEMVWREGMVDWRPVSSVAELRSALLTVPMPSRPVSSAVEDSPYVPPAVPGGMPAYVPTSGLAIASLICGLLGLITCMFLPGIPAVICGHMALKQLADPAVRMSGRGMALVGLITGYLSVVMLVGTVLLLLLMFVGGIRTIH